MRILKTRVLDDCWVFVCDGFSIELSNVRDFEFLGEGDFDPTLTLVSSCCTALIGVRLDDHNAVCCEQCQRELAHGLRLEDRYFTKAGEVLMYRLLTNPRFTHNPDVLRDWLDLSSLEPLEQELAYWELREELEAKVVELLSPYLEEYHLARLRGTVWNC